MIVGLEVKVLRDFYERQASIYSIYINATTGREHTISGEAPDPNTRSPFTILNFTCWNASLSQHDSLTITKGVKVFLR